jgi:hypothetical protein
MSRLNTCPWSSPYIQLAQDTPPYPLYLDSTPYFRDLPFLSPSSTTPLTPDPAAPF